MIAKLLIISSKILKKKLYIKKNTKNRLIKLVFLTFLGPYIFNKKYVFLTPGKYSFKTNPKHKKNLKKYIYKKNYNILDKLNGCFSFLSLR